MNPVLPLLVFASMLSLGSLYANEPAGNPQHDRLPEVLEFVAAQKLISQNGSLREIKGHYETALSLLAEFRHKYPNWYPANQDSEQLTLETELQFVNWQLEAAPQGNATDVRGLINVENHLRNRFVEAQRLMAAGSDGLAEKIWDQCGYSWEEFKLRYPKWHPGVADHEFLNCMNAINSHRVYREEELQPSRYRDPKFGTPLSV